MGGGLVILVIIIVNFLLAILLVAAPFAAPALAYYLLQRYGVKFKSAVLISVVPTLFLFAWALSGLIELNGQCADTHFTDKPPEKIGPIDALLIDGPGMWWLNGKIDIERPQFGKNNLFSRLVANKENKKTYISQLTETELLSKYIVTIDQPLGGDFLDRYLTSASITIEERSTGTIVARVREPVWGGGLIGSYIGVYSKLNPFHRMKYLSCGYAGNNLGIFRSSFKERQQLYLIADQKLIEQVFILSTKK